jgi:hypothetical protein
MLRLALNFYVIYVIGILSVNAIISGNHNHHPESQTSRIAEL